MFRWILRLYTLIVFQILCATCTKSSLTFVIDDTGSMEGDINQVKQAAEDILNIVMREKGGEIEDVLLVTFNDNPFYSKSVMLRTKTSDKSEFLEALNDIVVYGGDDCPENALEGIKLGLEESRDGSYLFVFTDASAKDFMKLNEIKQLCEEKQSQVVFIITGYCGNLFTPEHRVFYDIAKACSGQVFFVEKYEVKHVVKIIKETVKDKKSVLTWVTVPASYAQWRRVPFTVDDKTEYVIISTSGRNVNLQVRDGASYGGRQMATSNLLWSRSAKVVKFYAPRPGIYYVLVKGETDVSIVVYARTDFTFEHGFSEFVPKYLADASKLPIADRKHYLSISVTDPDNTVDIKTAEILDMNEIVIKQLPLKKADGDFYITEDTFVSPSTMFKIQVTGTVKKTGKSIRRISKTAIEPQIPPRPDSKVPVVTISEGTAVEVDYDGKILLTCKVSGYPAPVIFWTTGDSNHVLSRMSNVVELPYEYISYLQLANIQHPGTYYCRASNDLASRYSKIDVKPRLPFKVEPSLARTSVKFGEEKKLMCGISSSHPYDITWHTPLSPSDYTLSADKKVLTIKQVSIAAQGRYACKATLKSQPWQQQIIATNVVISDLAPPSLSLGSPSTITTVYGDPIHIWCKIAGGVPRPIINWQFMMYNDNVFKDLPTTSEHLIIDKASLANAGVYRCVAVNNVGESDQSTKVIVQWAPVIAIQEGPTKTITYGSSANLTCKTTAFPLPNVGWIDRSGGEIVSKRTIVNNEIISQVSLQNVKANSSYSCFAENGLGRNVGSIDLLVTSPFVVQSQPEVNLVSKYGARTDIPCGVKSSFPMNIRWFKSVGSAKSEIHTSDKYTISSTGNILHILHTDLSTTGKYTCEAVLKDDVNQKTDFTTEVQLDDLSPPVLQDTVSKKITVRNRNKVIVRCKIASGTPTPVVSWQVMKKGDRVFTDLSGSNQELVIDSVTLNDAGQYRCIAKNAMGEVDKTTEVIVQRAPVVAIQEGLKKTVTYRSSAKLTCKTTAFPLPKVGWFDSSGREIVSKNTIENNEITSQVNLQNVKENDTYSCFAENSLGKNIGSIDISVTSPFVVQSHPEVNLVSKYGARTDIPCGVKSSFPMNIRWFRSYGSAKSEIHTSDKYTISSTGNILHILHTDLSTTGKYTCEAVLKDDVNQKTDFTTEVQLDDLSPPVLQDTVSKKMTVRNMNKVIIRCKIASGTPTPVVSWQVMRKGDRVFTDLSESNQELVIDSVTLNDAGQYRCIAKNAMGEVDKTTEVIVQRAPVVAIQEGLKKTVTYRSSAKLTCKTTAFPLPKVGWFDSSGREIVSKNTIKNNEITSQVNLQNVKENDTYSCFAENGLGKNIGSIDISVTSPFVVQSHPEVNLVSKYGARTDIPCGVKSSFPMNIRWFKSVGSAKSEIHTSDKYTISSTGNILHILHTDLSTTGKYTCEAVLKDDVNQKTDFTTEVQLDDLSPPVLQDTVSKKITVRNKNKVIIRCKIASGTPTPVVSWQVMRKGDRVFTDLSGSNQELVIDSVTLNDAGQYRCIAKNAMGEVDKTTEVIVQRAPVVAIQEGLKKTVTYRSSAKLTCKTTAFPLPKVGWFDSSGREIVSKNTIENNEITSQVNLQNVKENDTYSCFAENGLGKNIGSIDISVTSPFVVQSHPEVNLVSKYGARTDIPCGVKSSFPMNIRWFKSVGSAKSEIHTSDKYTISSTGNILHILHTDLSTTGKYTCEAVLKDDVNQKTDFTTEVQLDDLSPPVLQDTVSKKITVRNRNKVIIRCKIASGTPTPVVSWQVMRKGDRVFTDLSGADQELVIDSVTLNDAGQYRCIAKNAMGEVDKTTEVIVQRAPVVAIQEGLKKTVTYRSSAKLTCKTTAFPLPKVGWFDSSGREIVSKNTIENNEIISQVNLQNVKENDTYSCFAENSLGKNIGSIDISVTSPFVVQSHPEVNLVSKYGARTDIPCGVKSSFPLIIRWFKSVGSAKSEILTSDKYTISSTGNILHILDTDLSTTGKYTCEAVLKDDVNQKTDFTTEVQLDDLSPPVLQDTVSKKITVRNKNKVIIRCKIASGTPTPVVSWQVMRKGDRVFTDLSESNQELVIDSVTLNDAGQYRCIAKNAMGEVDKTTEVIVQRAPVIAIQEGLKKTVTYRSSAKLTCKTTAFPLPKVGWFDSSGREIVSKNTIENNEITSQVNLQNVKENDTYSCFAENSLGKNIGSIDISVTSPFVVQSHPEVNLVSKYGARTDIPCGVKSSFPMNIRWFKSVGSAKSEIHTSDKYTISSTGNILHILHTDLSTTGKYTCEAVLKDDVNQKTDFTTEVQLDDLSPPVLQDTVSKKITVRNKNKVIIRCKIASGTPTPVVSWQVMKKGERVFTDLSGSDQELVIDSVTLNDAGQYRCIAKNAMGEVDKTTEVIVQRAPVVAIQEGLKKTVTYRSSAKLTCKTTAFPLPKVGWFDSSGREIVSKNTIENNEITSQVNLQNVKENDTYSCFAENSLGKNIGSIDISVTSPFVVQSHPEVNLVSKYGARTDIPCGVKSSFPLIIRWFKSVGSTKSEILTSDKYTISSTGNILHILHTDLSTTGKYTCEAVLKDDVNQKTDFTTEVQLDDLSPPVLQDTVSKKIAVRNMNKVIIRCKIASGTPTPVVSWQVMKKGDRVFTDLSGSDQELVIDSVTLNDAGPYRCIAKNAMGEVDKTTELIVEKAPESTIDQGATIVVPYGSTSELICRVVAYPPPRIVWTDTKGHELTSKDTINNSVVTSRLKVQNIRAADSYLCYAENNLGKSVARIQVSILPPIVFPVNGPETTSVKYGDPTTIMCDVKSSSPIKIKWFYQKTGQPEKSEIHATDKFLISPDDRELRITSTDLDLVGKYTCEASLVSDESEKKSFTTEVKINNLNAPEITYINKTITIMNGQKLLIGCKATGVPEPVTTWQVQPVNSNKYVTIPGQGDIMNTEISYELAGLYKCTATNKLGKVSRTTKVIVHGKPKITNVDSTYVGITGDRVLKIPCEVSGVPKPDISWKQGSKAATSDDKVTVSVDAIFIKNPTEKDSSNFTCEAKNIYGTATKNFEAVISDFITWNEDNNTNIFLKPGESADLKCTLTHSDPLSVRWYVNGEKVPGLGSFYKIKNANFGNDGNYTCRVNSDHGSDSLNYVVDVGYEPTFKLDPSSTVNWKGNQEESLDCDVNAKPGGDVKWTYNGKELNDNSAELPISGWGTYSCKVSNVHGSVQRTFDVTSDGCVVNRTAVRVKHTPLLIGDEASTWPRFDRENEFLTINKNEIITLECSTQEQPANSFKTHSTEKIIHAECLSEDNFIVDGKTLKFEELQCKETVRASQVFTKKSCMKTGELIEIGFQLSNGFLGVYSVCYSKVDHKTLFTKVDMLDVNLGNKVESSFKLNEGTKTVKKNPGEIIKCQYNQRWFVSPVDVAFGPAQTATLMFDKYNAVPVYEPCDGSSRISWTDVENVVQSALLTYNTLTAWTGASNYDSHGRPRYLWKVVKFEDDTFETIVYVNAPNPGSYDIKCAGNTSDSFSDVANAKDQYTYSCSLNDFTNAFGVPMSEFGITD